MSTDSFAEDPPPPPSPSGPPRRRIAFSTAIFAGATALSRVAGLGREVVQASYFGTSAAGSAFTVASQIPNLFSNLFSQAALSGAFVPVFTELIQQGRKKEAFKLASELFWLILVGLGALTAIWMGVAGFVMPLFTGTLHGTAVDLTAGLSRVLFPVVLLLSVTGLLVGILQSYDEFSMSALAPAVWNVVIIVLLVVLHAQYHGQQAIYAYAIAWLVATVVQMLLIASALRKIDFRLEMRIDWRDPRIRQVLILFVPVTVSIGIINIDIFLNAGLGTLVSVHAPIAINDAFRIYMLPQGIFSVAVATVLFPTLSRLAARRDVADMRHTLGNGIRQITLLLVPSAALMAVLATPITRLVYERGAFTGASTHLVSTALFWFAFSLPFAGVNLLLSRTFFALKRPWIPTKLAVDQRGRGRDPVARALQAAGRRRPGDWHPGGQRGHGRAADPAAAHRLQRSARARPDGDDHCPHPGRHRTQHGGRHGCCGRVWTPRSAAPGRPDRRDGYRPDRRWRDLRAAGAAHAHPRGPPDRVPDHGPLPGAGPPRPDRLGSPSYP